MFVGVGAARVRDLFEQARKAARRASSSSTSSTRSAARAAPAPIGGGHDEKEQTLNQLLVELDGFDPRAGIVLLAATNRPEILDPALLRAGRFDRQVLVDRPDKRRPRADPGGARCGRSSCAPTSSSSRSPRSRPASPAPTSPTSSTRRPCWPPGATATAVDHGRLQRRHRAHRRRPREEEPAAEPARARGRRLPRDGPRAGGAARCPAPTRCTRSRSSRAASARSATPSSARPRTAS